MTELKCDWLQIIWYELWISQFSYKFISIQTFNKSSALKHKATSLNDGMARLSVLSTHDTAAPTTPHKQPAKS
jgi:hypothetical protein